uniref:G-patch domain-containing protein n=1 Tax=Rhabditophanes sp. KR3021 TaxID=114890 RepID=A0AC35TJE6_9BILA
MSGDLYGSDEETVPEVVNKEEAPREAPLDFMRTQIEMARRRNQNLPKTVIPPRRRTFAEAPDSSSADMIIEKNKQIQKASHEARKSRTLNLAPVGFTTRKSTFMGEEVYDEYDPENYNKYSEVKALATKRLLENIKDQTTIGVPKVLTTTVKVTKPNLDYKINAINNAENKGESQYTKTTNVSLSIMQKQGFVAGSGLGKHEQGVKEALTVKKTGHGKGIIVPDKR